MIKVPIFDPSNIGIGDKLDYVNHNIERYLEMTNYDTPVGYINFILPGFINDNPDLNITPISPHLVDQALVSGFYDQDIMLYINYFGSKEELSERIQMYTNDYIIKEKKISPQWKVVVFFPMNSILECIGKEKFNMKYGLQLVGSDITAENISKHDDLGIKHFNLIFIDVGTEMKLQKPDLKLIKEVAAKYPESQFVIYALDSDNLNLPENCRIVVGKNFWNIYYID